ncbi:MAG: hypothetical protein MZV70_03675 [Desulfobacterales bacterium]|nr:hypothetical protein [Desulfobacterales bacterium]
MEPKFWRCFKFQIRGQCHDICLIGEVPFGGKEDIAQLLQGTRIFRVDPGSDTPAQADAALKYGTTITLWSDDLVYAFLRIATDEVAFAVINIGCAKMPFLLKWS